MSLTVPSAGLTIKCCSVGITRSGSRKNANNQISIGTNSNPINRIIRLATTPRFCGINSGRINAIVNDFFKTARGRELSEANGMQPLGGTPDDMAALMTHDIERLGPIVRAAPHK